MIVTNRIAERTLVFPATHPAGIAYIRAARQRGESVIGASSIWDDDTAREVGTLELLPYVHDDSFLHSLHALIAAQGIARIYSPVAAVHAWLSRAALAGLLTVPLLGESPIATEIQRHLRLRAAASRFKPFVDLCADGQSGLTELEITSILQMAEGIYGESNESKVAAMLGIFERAPEGDVVEIGSLAGRSASVLAWLTRRYGTGQMLAIDPWSACEAEQKDSPAAVRQDLVAAWDFDVLRDDFLCNLLPMGLGCMNYLQAPSAAGHQRYADTLTVESALFGKTEYAGRIAVLHIDGNHDYEAVALDCQLWLPHLAPGGWLILDDYLWAHGDGPYRIGNALLSEQADRIQLSFVCGKALFVQMRPAG